VSPRAEQRVVVGLLAAAVGLLVVARSRTWTTVPAELTTLARDVDLPGSVLWEIGLLYALLLAACLGVVVVARGGWRRAAGAAGAVLGLLALSQALDAGATPGKAVVRSDTGLERLGLDPVSDRGLVQRLSSADLPSTGWWPAALAGSAGSLVASAAVVARARRWEETAAGPTRGWREG
jgi:hypothetical protein